MRLATSFSLTINAQAAEGKKPPTDRQLIASAMSAAPANVGKDPTIVAMEANGKMRTIREGKNSFTCLPDNPATPGPDPMYMDKNAMEWVDAWIATNPSPTTTGSKPERT